LNIGFLGALDWEANREGLLWFLEKVWPVIKASKPQLNLNIAGRNAPNEFVEQLPANINYVGEVDSAKEFIEEQAIMIVPLLSGSGMRIKIIEALAMGRCAVTTTVAAEGIRYKNGVDLLVEDDPIVFGEKILEVTSDEKLCKKIGSAGEKLVKEQHDIEILVSRLLAFYKQSFDI
ncbi:MAG: glycosyltransferase involved in cell wall biosynthesis, partial [Limisphaerales bacterium]